NSRSQASSLQLKVTFPPSSLLFLPKVARSLSSSRQGVQSALPLTFTPQLPAIEQKNHCKPELKSPHCATSPVSGCWDSVVGGGKAEGCRDWWEGGREAKGVGAIIREEKSASLSCQLSGPQAWSEAWGAGWKSPSQDSRDWAWTASNSPSDSSRGKRLKADEKRSGIEELESDGFAMEGENTAPRLDESWAVYDKSAGK
ncbi:Tetratricopeptide repeat protein 22, partial [Dissostichus eleginoides]